MNNIIYSSNETSKDLLFNEYAFDDTQLDTFNGKIGIKDNSIVNAKLADSFVLDQSKIEGLSDSLTLMHNKINGILTQGVWKKTYGTYAEMLAEHTNLTVTDPDYNEGDYVTIVSDESPDSSLHTSGSASVWSNVEGILNFRRDLPTAIQLATNTRCGAVVGNNINGGVSVDVDGKMSLVGYLDLVTSIDALDSAISDLANVTEISDNALSDKIEAITVGSLGAATAEQGAKADTALQVETDPTVPEWAKQVNKPSYTNSEVTGAVDTVGILLDTTGIDTTVAEKSYSVTINTQHNDDAVTTSSIQIPIGTAGLRPESYFLKSEDATGPVSQLTTDVQTVKTQQAANTSAISNLNKNLSEGDWGEIDTGRTFRGKKIYRQDFTLYVTAAANIVADLNLIPTANYVADIITVGGYWSIGYNTEKWCLSSNTDGTNYGIVLIYGTDNKLTFRSKAANARTNATAIVIVEYTKN